MSLMSISISIKVTVLLCCLVLILIISRNSTKRPVNKAMVSYLLSLGFWQFCSLMVTVSSLYGFTNQVMLWYRLQVVGSLGYFVLFFALVTTFRNDLKRDRIRQTGYHLIFIAFLLVMFFGDLFLVEISVHSSGLYVPSFGPLIPVAGLISVIFLYLAFYDLWMDYSKYDHQVTRNRLIFLFISGSLVLMGSFTNFFPSLQGYPVDSLFILLQAVILSYAVLSQRLLDVQLIVREWLVKLFLLGIIGAFIGLALSIFSLKLYNPGGYTALIASLMMTILLLSSFKFLQEQLQRFVDNLFFPERNRLFYSTQELMQKTINITSLDTLTEEIILLCKNTFALESLHFFLKTFDNEDFMLYDSRTVVDPREGYRIRGDSLFIKWITDNASYSLMSELSVAPYLKGMWQREIDDFRRLQVEAIFPLIVKDELIGVLGVGPRANNRPFTQQFLQVIQLFAQQSSVLIKNAHLYEQTRLLSITDSLTGAYNRRMLSEAFAREKESDSESAGLILIDIYNFKYFNERYGHQAGDSVLKDVAKILQKSSSVTDIVIRYGGDEFAVFLPRADLQRTNKVVQAIDHNIQAWNIEQQASAEDQLIIKKGIYAGNADQLDNIIAEADKRLFEDQRNNDRKQFLSLVEDNIRNKKAYSQQAVLSLIKTVELRDRYTRGHSERVKDYSLQIAKEIGLYGPQLDRLETAALLHDIGKVGIPTEILIKKEPLSQEEMKIIRLHPTLGAEILREVEMLKDISILVLHHHERYDGDLSASPSAYPKGLKGEEIPFLSRIIAVADAFDAMTSHRPYRQPIHIKKVEKIITEEVGKQFDPIAAKAILHLLHNNKLVLGKDRLNDYCLESK